MFSYQASSWPQLMQAEPGETIERFSGTRAATTLRKLPIASPGDEGDGGERRVFICVLRPAVDRRCGTGDGVRRSGCPVRRAAAA